MKKKNRLKKIIKIKKTILKKILINNSQKKINFKMTKLISIQKLKILKIIKNKYIKSLMILMKLINKI